MKRYQRVQLLAGLATLLLAGCGKSPSPGAPSPPPAANRAGLSIVSGSENKSLEPILQQFARQNGITIDVTYLGSVEIGQELTKGKQCSFDAVWPASSLWIEVFDQRKVTQFAESILRTPVVFAVT